MKNTYKSRLRILFTASLLVSLFVSCDIISNLTDASKDTENSSKISREIVDMADGVFNLIGMVFENFEDPLNGVYPTGITITETNPQIELTMDLSSFTPPDDTTGVVVNGSIKLKKNSVDPAPLNITIDGSLLLSNSSYSSINLVGTGTWNEGSDPGNDDPDFLSGTFTVDGSSYSFEELIKAIDNEPENVGGDTGLAYTVTYSAETATSGTVPVDIFTYPEGSNVYIQMNTGNLQRPGALFTNWSDTSDCSGTLYTPGDHLIMPAANVTLYACWTSVSKIVASDPAEDDYFGELVDIDGDYAIVAASEKAYIFHRTGDNNWDSGYKLIASDATSDIGYGASVSISGDYAIIGAKENDGVVYLYQRTGTNTWGEETKIIAPTGAGNFGTDAVAIDGEYVIVGASQISTSMTAGSAFIYKRSSGNIWGSEAKLTGTDSYIGSWFGSAVAISGDYAIVGAYRDNGAVEDSGAAFLFHRTSDNIWEEEGKIFGSDGTQWDFFGCSVTIHGDYAVVGAHNTDSDSILRTGAVYVFLRSGTDWNQVSLLTATPKSENEHFGFSVAMNTDSIIIGNTTGTSYYTSELSGGVWGIPEKTGKPESIAQGFGSAVAIDDSYAIVGAQITDNDAVSDAGVVYVYPLD